MITTKRTHRVGITLAVACVMGVVLAVLGISNALAQKQEQTRKPAERVKALVLGEASSPVLTELRHKEGWQLTQAANAKGRGNNPSKYDVLIVDGDAHSPGQLGEDTLVDEFADANRWVLALDMDPADYNGGIIDHTGFTVGERSGKSSVFLFSRQMLNGSPRVVMIEAKSLQPLLSENHDDQQWLSQTTARQTQEVASSATRVVSADRSTLEEEYAPPGATNPIPDEAQHAGWTYSPEAESSAPPSPGYWSGNDSARTCIKAYDPVHKTCGIEAAIPEHGRQTPNWTFNHYFDAYLDNANRPQGNFQYLTYQLRGSFSPKSDEEKFWQMFDPFTLFYWNMGHEDQVPLQMERAWWTQQLGIQVKPDAQTAAKLVHEASAPATPNEVTKYSTEQEFEVGITGSREGPEVEASYHVVNGEEHEIPDWGVENKGHGNDLNWMFSARQPCDLRDEVLNTASCFISGIGPDAGMPKQPPDLSLNQLEVNAAGRWRTRDLLSGENGKATFAVKTPIALADTVCTDIGLIGCATFSKDVKRGAVGPNPQNDFWTSYGLDISAVNPIPVKAITFSPNPANGAKNDKVTGTVTLERPVPFDVKVVVFSNSENATVGTPVSGRVTRGKVKIPKGETSGNFQILTNDNKLKPGDHTTATITAFYTTPFQSQLRVESPQPASKPAEGKGGGGKQNSG